MRTKYLVTFFLLVLIIHIWGIYAGIEWIERLTKPMLLLILLGYFLWSTRSFSTGLKKWIVAALFLSWIGDLLLMFVSSSPDFFLAGLSSFLLAHGSYICFFHTIRVYEKIKGKLFLLLVVFVYYAVFMTMLTPWLGNLKLPVRIYSVVISFMLMLAMHMLYSSNKKAGWKMFFGALLFVVSDSVLAINKFYIPFAEAGIIIMITYGIAQLLLVQGAIQYITSMEGRNSLGTK